MSYSEDKFLFKYERDNTYSTVFGVSKIKKEAIELTMPQIKARIKVNKNASKETIRNRLAALGVVLIPVADGKEIQFITITSKEPYLSEDILFCKGTYHYDKNTIKKDVVYCPDRDFLSEPKDAKGELMRVELEVIKKVGKRNPD